MTVRQAIRLEFYTTRSLQRDETAGYIRLVRATGEGDPDTVMCDAECAELECDRSPIDSDTSVRNPVDDFTGTMPLSVQPGACAGERTCAKVVGGSIAKAVAGITHCESATLRFGFAARSWSIQRIGPRFRLSRVRRSAASRHRARSKDWAWACLRREFHADAPPGSGGGPPGLTENRLTSWQGCGFVPVSCRVHASLRAACMRAFAPHAPA
jgi:hypothetical protein